MKKFLKVFGIIVLLLLAILIIIPIAFKGKIITAVQKAANENVNAKVAFADLDLSLLRSFPHLSVKIDSLSIAGVDKFEADTLINVPKFDISINLRSLFSGGKYEVRTVDINDARIFLKVLEDGTANWDIMKEDTTAIKDTIVEPSEFDISLKKLSLNNSMIVYNDASLNTFVRADGVNHTLTGDFSETITDLDTKTTIDRLLVDYDGIRYLNRAKAELNSKITADLAAYKFTFPDAHLIVNELDLLAKGFFAMPDDGFDMDIKFEAVKNEFKSFLSLVPAVYAKDFDKVKSDGTLAFTGYVKGKYNDNTTPAFGLNLDIANGMFKYPDLPGTVNNINIKAIIDNKTGDPDATAIDVSRFHLEMMDNPIDAVFSVRTPVSDPYLDATVKGRLDLGDIAKIYPLEEGDRLAGMVIADFSVKGNQSDAENQRFNEFQADGQVNISDLVYNSESFAEGVSIARAQFNLSPSQISMPEMKMLIGKNDIAATGNITNYLAYAFDKGELRGVMQMQSNYFNVNDFMDDDTTAVQDTASSGMSIIEIPKDVDFTLNSTFNKVLYDKIELTNATGVVRIKDQALALQDLKFNALEGQMILNGTYSTKVPGKPTIDMAMNLSNIMVKEAFESFVTVQKLAPIARQTEGRISSNLRISSMLGPDMMPVFSTLLGNGSLTSPELAINNVTAFNKVADILKVEELKRWAVSKINLSFQIEDGKVSVKPFNTKLGKINAEIYGWNSFDQTLEYVMDLGIPRSTFGGAANNVLENLVSQANAKGANFSLGENVPVSVIISGTISDPKISTSLTGGKGGIKESIKDAIDQKKEEVVTKVKEEAGKYIEEANLRAQKLIDEAQVKANQLIATGEQSAQKIRNEANKQADQLVAEGKKKGMIGELAATKAAESVRSEGDKKATGVTTEAQKQADAIMKAARDQAEKIRAEARAKTN